MARPKGPVFALDRNGKAYVKVRECVINPIILIIDKVPFVRFEGEKINYISVEDAIAWFEKELEHDPYNRLYPKIIAAYRAGLEKIRLGKVIEA